MKYRDYIHGILYPMFTHIKLMQYKEVINQPLAGHVHIGMALTLVTVCCYSTCAEEDQITIHVGTKNLKL